MTKGHLLAASKDSIFVFNLKTHQLVANLKVATHQLRITMSQNGLLSYSASLIDGTINLHDLGKEDQTLSI